MTLLERIDAALALCEKATKGPWSWVDDSMLALLSAPDDDSVDAVFYDHTKHVPLDGVRIIETDSGFYPPREDDRAFIAAARTLLPAYARALKVAVEGLEETAALRSVYSEQANSLLRAIERELTGGGE